MLAIANLTASTLKNILVATDLSPASLWSLPYVVAIAHQYGSTIYLADALSSQGSSELPDLVFNLAVDTCWLLCRSRPSVLC
jgi:nucleotide-binding universal stress UspA family protein